MAPPASLLAAAIACTLPVALVVNAIVPGAYMDEIFHVPQAQRFCDLDFSSWDPMITTFPGLYVLSAGYKLLLQPLLAYFAQGHDGLCTPSVLRSVNLVLFLVTVLLFREILLELDQPKKRPGVASLKAMVLALYPLHWFFTFLYYTDVGSTAAVMAMYLAALKKSFRVAALFGAAAILFRQTNAVWTAFTVCIGVLQLLQEQESPLLAERIHQTDADIRADSLRRRRRNQAIEGPKRQRSPQGGLMSRIHHLVHQALQRFLPLLVVIVAFLGFTLYNGSIVVGAKEAHRVSPHFSQLLYFGLYAAAVLAPLHSVDSLILLRDYFRHRPAFTAVLVVSSVTIALLGVHFFSIAHPYLLADNRHYTFYIWKDVIQAHWIVKYSLVPCYLYSWWWIICSLSTCLRQRTKADILRYLWILSFCGATMAVLVPAPLVELRYYTVPFYILALETISRVDVQRWRLFMLALGFALVNAVTMSVFLLRPFTWSHQAGTQRFLW